MLVYCGEKEFKVTIEVDTFLFFFLEKTKKCAHVRVKSDLDENFFCHQLETMVLYQFIFSHFSKMDV